MLCETVGLQTINIGTERGQAEMLQGKLLGAGTNFTTGTGIRTSGWRIESAADVAWCSGILGEQAVSRPVKSAVGKGWRGEVGGREGRTRGLKRGKLENPVLPDSADGGGVEKRLAGTPSTRVKSKEAVDEGS